MGAPGRKSKFLMTASRISLSPMVPVPQVCTGGFGGVEGVGCGGTWAEVEVLDDGVQDLLVADGAGAVGVHVHRQRLRHADCVRHLRARPPPTPRQRHHQARRSHHCAGRSLEGPAQAVSGMPGCPGDRRMRSRRCSLYSSAMACCIPRQHPSILQVGGAEEQRCRYCGCTATMVHCFSILSSAGTARLLPCECMPQSLVTLCYPQRHQ